MYILGLSALEETQDLWNIIGSPANFPIMVRQKIFCVQFSLPLAAYLLLVCCCLLYVRLLLDDSLSHPAS